MDCGEIADEVDGNNQKVAGLFSEKGSTTPAALALLVAPDVTPRSISELRLQDRVLPNESRTPGGSNGYFGNGRT